MSRPDENGDAGGNDRDEEAAPGRAPSAPGPRDNDPESTAVDDGRYLSEPQNGDPQRVGRYRLLYRLGQGGMGTVYLGVGPDGERVAVKLLHHTLATDPVFRRRFRREVEAAKRVSRFCTAAVLDADVDGQTAYLVTEYVPGPNLREAVERDGPLRGSNLEGLAVTIAVALQAIHAADIVHRDLKPDNVLLSPVGPKVIDFGIARLADMSVQLSRGIIGTPSFMSPEQFQGGPITPASDVFAWGATIAYAGTGRAPFGRGPLPEVAYRVVNSTPDLSGLEGPLRTLVESALAKDPAERPAVQHILDTLTGRPAAEAPPAAPPGTRRRSRAGLLSGVGAAALALAVVLAVTSPGTDAPNPSGASSAPTAAVETTTSTTLPPSAGRNPLHGSDVRFSFSQEPEAQRQAEIWAAEGKEDDAALMRALAQVPHSIWLEGQATDGSTTAAAMRLAADHDAVPVFVTNNIPRSDCSERGAPNEQAYRAWIDQIAAGIGDGRAVIILEPNSLTRLPGTRNCTAGGPDEAAQRYRELTYAADRFGALPNTAVYLDAGVHGWPDLDEIVTRLVNAGVQRADGFYLNVSDFQPTNRLLSYGGTLSRCLYLRIARGDDTCGEAEAAAVPIDAPLIHFVIDTSRNGKGVWNPPEGKYADPEIACNPPGRGVGARPTTDTGDELADAFLWLRFPGRSSGQCTRGEGGAVDPVYGRVAPPAGVWWPALALERAKNAVPPLS